MGQEDAVVFSWEPVTTAAEGDGRDRPPESSRKAKAPALRLSVLPPPGRPSVPATTRCSSRARAVRPEDDPFLAAYLACTKSGSSGGGGGSGRMNWAEPKGRRRFTWAGLGLSCKGSSGAVEQSMVKMAKRPEQDPRDS